MAKTDKIDPREIAKQAAKEAVMQFHSEEEEISEELAGSLDKTNDIEEIRTPSAGFDLFQDIGDPRTEQGDIISYTIKRYGQFLATVEHPYSWTKLKEDYGPGLYQVTARSQAQKKYIKGETRTIAKDDFKASSMETPRPTREESSDRQGGLNILEIFTLMNQQTEAARREAKEQSQNQMLLMAEMFKSMASQNQPKQDNSFELFKMQMEMQQKSTERLIESQREMFKAISDRIDKIQENKKDSWDTQTIMKMTEDARNSGMNFAQQLFELAEKKAEEKASLVEELREEIKETIGSNENKGSMTDKLIETMLPTLATAFAAKQFQPQEAQPTPEQLAQMQLQAKQLAEANQRRQLIIRNKKLKAAELARINKESQGANKPARTQTKIAKNEESPVSTSGEIFTSPGTVDSSLPTLNLETAHEEVRAVQTEIVDNRAESAIKAQCREILPMFLGGLMLEETPVSDAAPKTIAFLAENGIDKQTFLVHVKAKDLVQVAIDYALPKEAELWLNELYEHIEKNS